MNRYRCSFEFVLKEAVDYHETVERIRRAMASIEGSYSGIMIDGIGFTRVKEEDET